MTTQGIDVNVLSQAEVVHALAEAPGNHVAFVGAGVSKEAGCRWPGRYPRTSGKNS
nr:hypothetical protein GCM10020093_094980 [Planobispora longispora]